MSFVGTRPEAVKYVEKYKPEYFATLLLPAGITSEASIRYKNEAELSLAVSAGNGIPGPKSWEAPSDLGRSGRHHKINTMRIIKKVKCNK